MQHGYDRRQHAITVLDIMRAARVRDHLVGKDAAYCIEMRALQLRTNRLKIRLDIADT
jgi:hypothetical protein